ncbi:MAG: hypothetical protein L0Y71_13245 [Gemmataceae bacterium]|nr:hypothetical protein [Gemmataceae bacterium]
MRLLIASICVASLVLAGQRPALAQKGGVEQLKREPGESARARSPANRRRHPPMIKRFPIATIESAFGPNASTIDFRNVPAIVSKTKSK